MDTFLRRAESWRKMSATFYDWIIDKKMSQIALPSMSMCQKPFPLLFVFLLSFLPVRMRKKLAASTLGPRHCWTAENYVEIMNPPTISMSTALRPLRNWHWFSIHIHRHKTKHFPQKAKATKMRNENKTDRERVKKGLSIDVEEISFRFTLVEVEVKKAQK